MSERTNVSTRVPFMGSYYMLNRFLDEYTCTWNIGQFTNVGTSKLSVTDAHSYPGAAQLEAEIKIKHAIRTHRRNAY